MSEHFTKEDPHAPPGFFAAEARGLAWLRAAVGGPPVPDVVEVSARHIVLTRIEQGRPTTTMAEAFGRALASLHGAGAAAYGFDDDGFIGPLPLDNTESDDWPEWYAERRVRPYLRLAADRHWIDAQDRSAIERACERLPPTDDPIARIHGDLWTGNLLWATDGRVWLIDAGSAHGGQRESDIAMLMLFGAPHLDTIIAAYDEAWPLADGWRDRVGVHQLHPLLVHAALFGGGYGSRAGAIARRL